MLDEDLLADLPALHDNEPPSLRSDIVDELADHLHCAFRREVLKDGDETAAEQRVLDRFGDPKKLARRLWRQAMWSRIMGKKILSGLQWVLTLAAVFLACLVLRQQSEILTEMNAGRAADANWRSSLQLTLTDLRSRLPAQPPTASQPPVESGGMGGGGGAFFAATKPADANPPALIVKLVQDTEDGPPVTSTIEKMTLTGAGHSFRGVPQAVLFGGGMMAAGMPGGMGGGMANQASANGVFDFRDIEPDHYELSITLADGQHSTRPVLIRDDKPQELTIVCPGPRKKVPVLITVPPLPEDLRTARYVLKCTFWPAALELGQNRWLSKSSHLHEVAFDPETGQMVSINSRIGGSQQYIVLQDTPPEDRVLFFETGPVYFQYETAQTLDGPGSVPLFRWPKDAHKIPIRNVVPGENRWELELPEELIAEVRKQLAVLNPDEPSGGEPGATP